LGNFFIALPFFTLEAVQLSFGSFPEGVLGLIILRDDIALVDVVNVTVLLNKLTVVSVNGKDSSLLNRLSRESCHLLISGFPGGVNGHVILRNHVTTADKFDVAVLFFKLTAAAAISSSFVQVFFLFQEQVLFSLGSRAINNLAVLGDNNAIFDKKNIAIVGMKCTVRRVNNNNWS